MLSEREREAVDGARDAFEERVRWFYANAPECQEARRHSFSRQRDMAFVLTRNEDRAAVRSAVLAEVRAKVEACPRVRYTDPLGFYLRTVLDVADIRAALTALEATDGR